MKPPSGFVALNPCREKTGRRASEQTPHVLMLFAVISAYFDYIPTFIYPTPRKRNRLVSSDRVLSDIDYWMYALCVGYYLSRFYLIMLFLDVIKRVLY